MKIPHLSILAAAPMLLLFPLIASGQKGPLRLEPIVLPTYTPGYVVQKASEDAAGLLWYLTNDGLYRYDGTSLVHIGTDTKPALPSLPVNCFVPDDKNNIWIGLSGGAALFDLKSWTVTPLYAADWDDHHPMDKSITAIACLSGGGVLLGARSGKLYVLKDNKLTLLLDAGETITNILETQPGRLWITTGVGMLISLPFARHNPDEPGVDSMGGEDSLLSFGSAAYFWPAETQGQPIANICYDRSGKCLFSADSLGEFMADLHRLYALRDKASRRPHDLPRMGYVKKVTMPAHFLNIICSPFKIADDVTAIMTGRANEPKRIYTFNYSTEDWHLVTPSFPVQFPGGAVANVSPTSSGAYVCSGSTLTWIRFAAEPIASILAGFGSNNSIRSVYKKGDSLYIGSYRDGFIRYDINDGRVTQLVSHKMFIYNILPWGPDRLLLANEGRRLFWYTPSTNGLARLSVKDQPSADKHYQAHSPFATVLCRVNDTLVLEGTYEGLQFINPLKETLYPIFTDSLSALMQSLKVNAIIPGTDSKPGHLGSYLVATEAGVFRVHLDNGRVAYLFGEGVESTIRDAPAYSLLGVNGQIWVGSGRLGVQVCDSLGHLKPMRWLNKQLGGRIIYSLVKSGEYILIGTNKGLDVLRLKDSSISRYTTYDGLPADEFNQAAVFRNDTEAYLGTVNGLVHWHVNGAGRYARRAVPDVRVSKLTILSKDGKKQISYSLPYLPSDSQQIEVPAGTGYFSVSFGETGGKFRELVYYYRLDERNPWIELGGQSRIAFVETPPGKYRLELAAHAPNGNWMPNLLQIPVTVLPTVYQTWWFKVLCGMMVAGILWLIVRYREMQARKERNLRMKIAGDLHDEVGGLLAGIWHQTWQMLVRTDSLAEPALTTLRQISNTSREALSMMGDMVWSIDARFDTLDELILRMKDYVYRINNDLNTALSFQVEGTSKNKKLSQVVRQNLFLVFKESLTNAIKHGHGEAVSIRILLGDTQLTLEVRNTFSKGLAMDQAVVQGGNGLYNMRRRVQNMRGDLQFEEHQNEFIVRVTV